MLNPKPPFVFYRDCRVFGDSSAGNFMVCDKCDTGNEDLIKTRQEALKLLNVVPDEFEASMVVAFQLAKKLKEI